MNHQPFESWLLNEDPLTPQQRGELNLHLADCENCGTLDGSLRAMEKALRSAPMAAPVSGFTRRFQMSLPARQALEQRRLLQRFFAIALLLTTGIFTLLAVTSLFSSGPAAWVNLFLQSVVRAAIVFQQTEDVIGNLIQVIPVPILVLVWIATTLTVCFLSLGWAASIWKIASLGAQTK